MEDIKKLWDEANSEYKDMYSRLSFVERKDGSLLEKRPIKDKMILLMTDLKEVINSMEKICFSIDDIYASQGTIATKVNEEKHICAKRVNSNGKLFKVITHVQTN
jgi:hypothetical protein